MSKHLQAFIEEEFNKFVGTYLEDEVDSLRDIEEPFEELVTEAFNEYVQNEMSVKDLLATFLAQDDMLDDREALKGRLEYWDSPENGESEQEVQHQKTGIKLLIKGCS